MVSWREAFKYSLKFLLYVIGFWILGIVFFFAGSMLVAYAVVGGSRYAVGGIILIFSGYIIVILGTIVVFFKQILDAVGK
jgi:hypothetical protein